MLLPAAGPRARRSATGTRREHRHRHEEGRGGAAGKSSARSAAALLCDPVRDGGDGGGGEVKQTPHKPLYKLTVWARSVWPTERDESLLWGVRLCGGSGGGEVHEGSRTDLVVL